MTRPTFCVAHPHGIVYKEQLLQEFIAIYSGRLQVACRYLFNYLCASDILYSKVWMSPMMAMRIAGTAALVF